MARSVSVIVPCYNYAHYLAGCVDSIVSQPDVDVEVLIIDDCSTDDTPIVGAELARDDRVEFRRHEKNIGHIATYNEGLDWVRGDYTVLLSADDLLTPGALARSVSVMERSAEVGIVYGRVIRFDEGPLPAPRDATPDPRPWRGGAWIERCCRTGQNPISSPEVVARTTLYKTLGGYRADLPHAADLEMWLRFAAHADLVYLRGVDQAYYRWHLASMSKTRFSAVIDDFRQRKLTFDAVFDHYSDRIPDAARLRRTANRTLAREVLWYACRAYDLDRLEDESVEELEAFARGCDPDADRLLESRELRLRRRIGPQWAPKVQYLLPSVYWHALRRRIRERRMEAIGA